MAFDIMQHALRTHEVEEARALARAIDDRTPAKRSDADYEIEAVIERPRRP
jgi:hypothetical protein